jgi:hypothetical protein
MDAYGFPLYPGDDGPKGFSNPFESEVQSLVTIGGITDDRTIYALNNLTRELKNSGLWDKMIYVYPIAGNSRTSMSLNLKNPGSTSIIYGSTIRISKNGIATVPGSFTSTLSPGFNLEELNPIDFSFGFLINGGAINPFANALINFTGGNAAGSTGGIFLNANFASLSNPITTSVFLNTTFVISGGTALFRSKWGSPMEGLISVSRRSNTVNEIYENGKLFTRFVSPIEDNTSFNTGNVKLALYVSNANGNAAITSFIYASKYLNELEMSQFYNIIKKYQISLDRFKPQSFWGDSLYP